MYHGMSKRSENILRLEEKLDVPRADLASKGTNWSMDDLSNIEKTRGDGRVLHGGAYARERLPSRRWLRKRVQRHRCMWDQCSFVVLSLLTFSALTSPGSKSRGARMSTDPVDYLTMLKSTGSNRGWPGRDGMAILEKSRKRMRVEDEASDWSRRGRWREEGREVAV
ncbi:hypothetical protein C8F04DRAFT_1301933 [Mycena alexandri]|uniref:Uncharacterized protein n=1 Tax=Mycena alexandri TaxID=1745969 RepID=A0AAD6SCA1_9AGAR|nr:hypothetical protein C8F04DRAFT_1301933 [Mycena alexandri]